MRGLGILLAAVLLSACSLLEPVPIDGRPVAGEATVTFSDGLTAVIDTACRTTDVGYALDTDGAALGFGDMGPTPHGCTGEASEQDRAVKNALLAVQEWRVLDSDHIRFIGGPPVTLARAQPPQTPSADAAALGRIAFAKVSARASASSPGRTNTTPSGRDASHSNRSSLPSGHGVQVDM